MSEWPSRQTARKIMLFVAIALVALTFVPYLTQALNPPPGRVFAWMFFRLPDEASYLMWIQQHAAGRFFVENKMALDVQGQIPPNPVWLLLGFAQKVTGLSGIAIYHAGRAVLALCHFWVLSSLCLTVLPTPRQALVCFLSILVGSGLGWLWDVGIPLRSADWITEMWSFPSIFHYPHFAAALALLAYGLKELWLSYEKGPKLDLVLATLTNPRPFEGPALKIDSHSIKAGLAWAFLVWVHPYTAGTVYLALGLTMLVTFIRMLTGRAFGAFDLTTRVEIWFAILKPGVVVLGLGTLSVGLMAGLLFTSPAMQSWAALNRLPSPSPFAYLLGFGFVGLLALAGIVKKLRRADFPWHFLIGWLVTAMALAYAGPLIPFERRCIEGVHIALAIFATVAIGPFFDRLSKRAAIIALIVLAAALAPTNAVMLWKEATAKSPSAQIKDDWPQLFAAVKDLPEPRTVCTDPRTAMFLAGFAAAKVNTGHDQLTPNLNQKAAEFHEFSTTPASWDLRVKWMQDAGCQWLVLTPKTVAALPKDNFPEPVKAGKTWVIVGPAESP